MARACALALRNGESNEVMRNPLDGRPLSCDRTYPSTVVITSRSFAPLQTPQNCGGTSLAAGTRAAQYLVLGAKARAVLAGRAHATTEDIQALARPVLRHRVLVNYRAEAEGVSVETVIDRLLDHVQPS